MLDYLVIFRFDSFGHHVGIIVVVEDAIPDDVGGCINILYDEAASSISRLDLGLFDRDEQVGCHIHVLKSKFGMSIRCTSKRDGAPYLIWLARS